MGQVFAVIVGRLISTVTACRRFLLTIPSIISRLTYHGTYHGTLLPILFFRVSFGRDAGLRW